MTKMLFVLQSKYLLNVILNASSFWKVVVLVFNYYIYIFGCLETEGFCFYGFCYVVFVGVAQALLCVKA